MKDEGSREKTVEYLANILDLYGTLTTYPLSTDMIRDIVGLLKAQAPRVLTLHECYRSPFVWIESREADAILGVRRIRPITREPGMLMVFSLDAPMMMSRERDYGRDWRCWDQFPNDQQRGAVKWDADGA